MNSQKESNESVEKQKNFLQGLQNFKSPLK